MKKKNEMQPRGMQNSQSGLIASITNGQWFWGNLLSRSFYLAIFLFSFSFISCSKSSQGVQGKFPAAPYLKEYSNKVILDWNIVAFDAMGGSSYQNTLVAARLNAIVHIAMHDALNSIAPAYETYALKTTNSNAHPIAAAASAAYYVLLNQFPEKKAMLDAKLAQSIDSIPPSVSKQQALQLGEQAANAILALRSSDGAFADPITVLPPSTVPGVYQAVPPFDFVFAPFWAKMKPFGIVKPEQFRSVTPPVVNSAVYTIDFNEVKNYGSKNSTLRTADQTFYAKFWYEFSEIGWNRIGRVAATDHKLDLLATARLFALLDIALADSYTAGWDSKFHYNFWRPFTAIRRAATDGNDKTEADTQWETLMPTPPVQDYPSTHSVLGNAGATVLTAFFGNSDFTFTSPSAEPVNASRSFKSFFKAADENADSRVKAGIHFRFATAAGQKMGNQVGEWVLKNNLKARK